VNATIRLTLTEIEGVPWLRPGSILCTGEIYKSLDDRGRCQLLCIARGSAPGELIVAKFYDVVVRVPAVCVPA
jgi:hypothetical protein